MIPKTSIRMRDFWKKISKNYLIIKKLQLSKDSNSKVYYFITVNKIVLWMVWQVLQIITHKPILATALNLLDSMEIVQDQIRKLQKEIYVLHHRQEDNSTQVIFRRLLLVYLYHKLSLSTTSIMDCQLFCQKLVKWKHKH